jgi:beta-lactamase class A
MRVKISVIAVVIIAFALAASLIWIRPLARTTGSRENTPNQSSHHNSTQPQERESLVDERLVERLRTICERAEGEISVAVIHVESGRTAEINGARRLPLYSVFKLPLAIAVLKDVEENRLRLDQRVRVMPEEVVPGWRGNTELWREPVERTVAELLELSIVRSDNTSSDKLLQLVGGPETVTRRMRAMGFENIEIRSTVREFAAQPTRPNLGAAIDIAQLLARLQKGEILQPSQFALLRGFMERTTTGLQRLRGGLPTGTIVADKTGTGDAGSTTNDVGIITLPRGGGHLAMAVLITGSRLSPEAQERIIADLARAAYNTHVSHN